jgi:hypothetical protein
MCIRIFRLSKYASHNPTPQQSLGSLGRPGVAIRQEIEGNFARVKGAMNAHASTLPELMPPNQMQSSVILFGGFTEGTKQPALPSDVQQWFQTLSQP